MLATCTTSLPTFFHISSGSTPERQELKRILDRPEAITEETSPADVLVIWAEDLPGVKEQAKQICERGSALVVVFTFPSHDELERSQPDLLEDLPDFVPFDLLAQLPADIIEAIKIAKKPKAEVAA